MVDRDGTHWAEGAPSTGRAWPEVSLTVPQPAVITAPDRKGHAPRFRARLGRVGHRPVRGPAGLQEVPRDTRHRPCLACSSSAVGSACLVGIIIETSRAKTSAPVPTAMTAHVGAEPPRSHAISTRLPAIPEPRSLRDWHHEPGPGLLSPLQISNTIRPAAATPESRPPSSRPKSQKRRRSRALNYLYKKLTKLEMLWLQGRKRERYVFVRN